MQLNPHGVYDASSWKERYDFVIKSAYFTLSSIYFNSTAPSTCATGNTYTTKSGDTCNTIAQANQVSSGSPYKINTALYNRNNPGGRYGCLFGAQILGRQTKLGHTICVSPPGGAFYHTPGNNTCGGVGGPKGCGDGYADTITQLPAGSTLEPISTKYCGEFYTAKGGDTWRGILVNANTPSDLFITVNPLIMSAEACNANMKAALTRRRPQMGQGRQFRQEAGRPLSDLPLTPPPSSTTVSRASTTTSTAILTTTSTPGTNLISPNGLCGSNSPVNATCGGSSFGSCCSNYGFYVTVLCSVSLPACIRVVHQRKSPEPRWNLQVAITDWGDVQRKSIWRLLLFQRLLWKLVLILWLGVSEGVWDMYLEVVLAFGPFSSSEV
ncbi:uncharacterized protein BDR25DRAFT_355585 [Lindgomyces ingoldianus]|uniref:Uncharacterized protein n=1 Tax=Lindgomyces ingoldianus TaxID=673940 RepID=A0ACB6QTZ3_9PLEO|nr:uncharacterized protein BDR25DRAFT_355585 [Lindgomyces ingoldianus]KAF2470484.1 hypothetical protein BDR25DRAFT_355585 [Lindgomyces ingoldianus]